MAATRVCGRAAGGVSMQNRGLCHRGCHAGGRAEGPSWLELASSGSVPLGLRLVLHHRAPLLCLALCQLPRGLKEEARGCQGP